MANLTSILMARRSLDRKLAGLVDTDGLRRPPHGWVRAIRDALGMSSRQLAARMQVSQPRVSKLEKDEVRGRVSLDTLQRAAEAMDCRLVYAIVPVDSLDAIVDRRADTKAATLVERVSHHMLLEDQALADAPKERQRAIVKAELVNAHWRRLWDPDE